MKKLDVILHICALPQLYIKQNQSCLRLYPPGQIFWIRSCWCRVYCIQWSYCIPVGICSRFTACAEIEKVHSYQCVLNKYWGRVTYVKICIKTLHLKKGEKTPLKFYEDHDKRYNIHVFPFCMVNLKKSNLYTVNLIFITLIVQKRRFSMLFL